MTSQTIKAKLPKSVKRITILKSDQSDAESGPSERIVVETKRKKKKQSKGLLKLLERATHQAAQANQAASDNYLDRHRRSNRKRRDGWLRDFSYNVFKSRRKGNRKIKLSRLFD